MTFENKILVSHVLMRWVKPWSVMLMPHLVAGLSPAVPLLMQFPAIVPRKAMEDGASAWASAVRVEDLDEIPGPGSASPGSSSHLGSYTLNGRSLLHSFLAKMPRSNWEISLYLLFPVSFKINKCSD